MGELEAKELDVHGLPIRSNQSNKRSSASVRRSMRPAVLNRLRSGRRYWGHLWPEFGGPVQPRARPTQPSGAGTQHKSGMGTQQGLETSTKKAASSRNRHRRCFRGRTALCNTGFINLTCLSCAFLERTHQLHKRFLGTPDPERVELLVAFNGHDHQWATRNCPGHQRQRIGA